MKNSDGILDSFTTLLRTAEDNLDIRAHIQSILRLPAFQRASLINTAVEEMLLLGEPLEICEAFRLLGTDEGAQATLRVLSESDGSCQAG